MTTDNITNNESAVDKTRTIFIIYGTWDTGKTTIIRRIYCNLLKAFPEAKKNYYKIYKVREEKTDNLHDEEDFRCIITIEKIRIGIMSDGDEPDSVNDALTDFKKEDCHIIICACHPKGEAKEHVTTCSHDPKGYYSCWFRTFKIWDDCYDDSERRRLYKNYNHGMAEAIFDMVEDRIVKIRPLIELEK